MNEGLISHSFIMLHSSLIASHLLTYLSVNVSVDRYTFFVISVDRYTFYVT
jgi:hypothetical protein